MLLPEIPGVDPAIPALRRQRIIETLTMRRALRVSSLVKELGVSEMTIRRDLERLESEGLLLRQHGGAILKRHISQVPPYLDNATTHVAEKQRIARRAAAMIKTGETVFLGSGSTAAQVLRHVDPHLKARVITHNVGALAEARGSALDIVLLGGVFSARSNTIEGPPSIEIVAHYRAAKTFLGVDGMDLAEGLTTPSLGLASIESAMIRQTRGDVIVLADQSKIGVVCDVTICALDQVNVVIMDEGVSEGVREEVGQLGLRVVVV